MDAVGGKLHLVLSQLLFLGFALVADPVGLDLRLLLLEGRVWRVSSSEEISLRFISCSMGAAMAAARARIPSGDSSASDIRRAIVSMYSWLCTFTWVVSIVDILL